MTPPTTLAPISLEPVPRRPGRRKRKFDPHYVVSVYNKDNSIVQTAAIVGCSAATVLRLVHELGVFRKNSHSLKVYASKRAQKIITKGEKRCTVCRQTKSLSFFFKNKRSATGFASECKLCRTRKRNEWRRHNGNENAGNRRRLALTKDRKYYLLAKDRDSFIERRRQTDRQRLLRKKGMTHDDFVRMFEMQGGKCAICRLPISTETKRGGGGTSAHIDHCHTQNVVRGLLCGHCNKLIGLARDNEATLLAAIAYLQAPPAAALNLKTMQPAV